MPNTTFGRHRIAHCWQQRHSKMRQGWILYNRQVLRKQAETFMDRWPPVTTKLPPRCNAEPVRQLLLFIVSLLSVHRSFNCRRKRSHPRSATRNDAADKVHALRASATLHSPVPYISHKHHTAVASAIHQSQAPHITGQRHTFFASAIHLSPAPYISRQCYISLASATHHWPAPYITGQRHTFFASAIHLSPVPHIQRHNHSPVPHITGQLHTTVASVIVDQIIVVMRSCHSSRPKPPPRFNAEPVRQLVVVFVELFPSLHHFIVDRRGSSQS